MAKRRPKKTSISDTQPKFNARGRRAEIPSEETCVLRIFKRSPNRAISAREIFEIVSNHAYLHDDSRFLIGTDDIRVVLRRFVENGTITACTRKEADAGNTRYRLVK